jgi:hypothetical protein
MRVILVRRRAVLGLLSTVVGVPCRWWRTAWLEVLRKASIGHSLASVGKVSVTSDRSTLLAAASGRGAVSEHASEAPAPSS